MQFHAPVVDKANGLSSVYLIYISQITLFHVSAALNLPRNILWEIPYQSFYIPYHIPVGITFR
jgi:hypothetical protein